MGFLRDLLRRKPDIVGLHLEKATPAQPTVEFHFIDKSNKEYYQKKLVVKESEPFAGNNMLAGIEVWANQSKGKADKVEEGSANPNPPSFALCLLMSQKKQEIILSSLGDDNPPKFKIGLDDNTDALFPRGQIASPAPAYIKLNAENVKNLLMHLEQRGVISNGTVRVASAFVDLVKQRGLQEIDEVMVRKNADSARSVQPVNLR